MEIADLVRDKGYEVIILNPNGNYWYNNRAWVITVRSLTRCQNVN